MNDTLDAHERLERLYQACGDPVLRGVVGSTVHGTAIDGTDDRDEMAIVIEPPNMSIGLDKPFGSVFLRTQPEGVRSGPHDIDLQVHSLRKFCKLALKGNPSILLMFYLPEYMEETLVGIKLIEMAPLFVSRHAANAFMGYMKQQRERLEGKRGQKNVNRSELVEKYGFDTKYAGHIIRLGHQGLEYVTTGKITLPMPAASRSHVVETRLGKHSLESVLDEAESMERALAAAAVDLPPNGDAAKVNSWLIDTYLEAWGT